MSLDFLIPCYSTSQLPWLTYLSTPSGPNTKGLSGLQLNPSIYCQQYRECLYFAKLSWLNDTPRLAFRKRTSSILVHFRFPLSSYHTNKLYRIVQLSKSVQCFLLESPSPRNSSNFHNHHLIRYFIIKHTEPKKLHNFRPPHFIQHSILHLV